MGLTDRGSRVWDFGFRVLTSGYQGTMRNGTGPRTRDARPLSGLGFGA